MTKKVNGGCLCGSVKFEIAPPFSKFYVCHCTRCQKASGTAHASNLCGEVTAIKWLCGEELITQFELSASSYFNRSFCQKCGSPVPTYAKSEPMIIIPAGSLNDLTEHVPTSNIFWPNRAQWYDAGCEAPKYVDYLTELS